MDYTLVNTTHERHWRPGFFRRLPWTAVGCILGALLGVVASIAILRVSDGVPISSWPYPPTVYLSVSYTITNILIAVALSHGVSVSWWRKAMGSNTELGDLHRYWEFGTSPMAAAMAGKKFNFIAFASLLVAITPANGPLLQRSSSVVVVAASSPVTLRIMSVPFIQDPTGYLSGRGLQPSLLSNKFAPVVQSFYDGVAVSANDTGCPGDGICTGHLQGVGLAVNCSSYTSPFNITPSGTNSSDLDRAFQGIDVFSTAFTWSTMSPGNLSFSTQYKLSTAKNFTCSGSLMIQNCSLQVATVQYPVVIDGNKSTIKIDPSSSIIDDIVNDIPNYPYSNIPGPTSLGGYALALNNRYQGVSHLRFVGAVGYELLSTGATGPQFANMEDVVDIEASMCNIKFADPTQNLLAQARELMFRTSLAFGNASTVQSVAGTQERTTNVYRSHYEFLAAAVALTLVSILMVAATLYGYWTLGRNMSMSPVEIAKAFNATLLVDADSNAEAKELIKLAGTRRVRYQRVSGNAQKIDGDKIESLEAETNVEHTQTHLEIIGT